MGTPYIPFDSNLMSPLGSSIPISAPAANTPGKLAAQETYWRWFQQADAGEDSGCGGVEGPW